MGRLSCRTREPSARRLLSCILKVSADLRVASDTGRTQVEEEDAVPEELVRNVAPRIVRHDNSETYGGLGLMMEQQVCHV